MVTVWQHRCV